MERPLYPEIADVSHVDQKTAEFFSEFFSVKSRHDVGATMTYFSSDLATYTDTTLGWATNSFDELNTLFGQ